MPLSFYPSGLAPDATRSERRDACCDSGRTYERFDFDFQFRFNALHNRHLQKVQEKSKFLLGRHASVFDDRMLRSVLNFGPTGILSITRTVRSFCIILISHFPPYPYFPLPTPPLTYTCPIPHLPHQSVQFAK